MPKNDYLKKVFDNKALVAVLILCLILRIGYALVYHDPVTSDSAQYDALAYNTLTGKGYVLNTSLSTSNISNYAIEAHPSAWRPPGYPLFLISVYAVFGHSYDAVHLLQAFIATITGLLIYIVGNKLWGHRAALAGLIFYSVWPPFVVLPAQLLTETLNNFLVVLSIYLAVEIIYNGRHNIWHWVLLGAVSGYAAITRPTYLLFPPFAILLAYVLKHIDFKDKSRRKMRRINWASAKYALMALLVSLLIIGAWTARNLSEMDAFVPGSTMSGLGIYFGTTPFNTSINGNPQPGDPVYANITQTSLTEVEKSRMLTSAGLSNIVERPLKTLAIKADNIYRVWNMPYIARTINDPSYDNLMQNNWVIRTFLPRGSPQFHAALYAYIGIHALIILVFVLSLFMERWFRNKGIIFVYGVVLYLNAMIFLTFGIDRYVLAVMPFISIAAFHITFNYFAKSKSPNS